MIRKKKNLIVGIFFLMFFIAGVSIGQNNNRLLLAKVSNYNLWGFIDTTGNYVIKPSFEIVNDFSEGLAAARSINGKWGYINTKGKFVIPPIYKLADNFKEGRARIYSKGGWGYIDSTGAVIIECQFQGAGNFNGGYAVVRNSLWGIIDRNGKIIVPFVHPNMKQMTCGRAMVKVEGRFGYINLQNQLAVKNEFYRVDYFFGGLAKVWGNGGLGFIDTSGKWVVNLNEEITHSSFDIALDIGYFQEGRVFVKDNYYHMYAIYDSTGKKITPYKFNKFRNFSEGLAAVKSGRWGYVNKKGEFVIEPTFKEVRDFSFGYAAVELADNQWGYIDKNGKMIIKPQYYRCSKFSDPFLTFQDKFE